MIYKYLRVSTDKQDERQQENTIDNYLQNNRLKADGKLIEHKSGKISYKKRELYSYIQSMNEGDTLIVSELSRFSRSISDFNILINELKIKKLIIIICNINLRIDCYNINSITLFQLNSLAFAAQLDLELNSSRAKSFKAVEKREIEENGFRITKAGKIQKFRGRPRLTPEEKAERAEKNKIKNKEYYKKNYIKKLKKGLTPEQIRISKQIMIYRGQGLTFMKIVDLLNKVEPKKESGKPYHSGDVTLGIANFQDFELGEFETSELMSEYVNNNIYPLQLEL